MKLPKKANDPPPATLGPGVGGGDDGKGVVEVEEGGTAEPSEKRACNFNAMINIELW